MINIKVNGIVITNIKFYFYQLAYTNMDNPLSSHNQSISTI
jgi:hypothetical protein